MSNDKHGAEDAGWEDQRIVEAAKRATPIADAVPDNAADTLRQVRSSIEQYMDALRAEFDDERYWLHWAPVFHRIFDIIDAACAAQAATTAEGGETDE